MLISTFPHAVWAQSSGQSFELTDKDSQYRFHGRRFSGQLVRTSDASSRPPFILAHGILNSYGITEKLAKYLEAQGFDVWIYNQPGFGQEGKVTTKVGSGGPQVGAKEMATDYGLLSLVSGVEAMVKHVTKVTGKKPMFGGFSLGGIALDLYLQGVVGIEQDGSVLVDRRKSTLRQKSLARAVFIGAPVLSFTEMTRGLKIMYGAAACANCVIGERRTGFLNLGLGQSESVVSKAAGWTTKLTPNLLLKFYLQDVTNYQNLDADSRATDKYLALRFSNIHMDLIRDLVRASKKIDSLKANPLTHVDAIYVVGTKDGLANYRQVKAVVDERSRFNPGHQLITVEGAGHLDLMENKMIEGKYGEILKDRLLAPKDQQWFLICRDLFRAV